MTIASGLRPRRVNVPASFAQGGTSAATRLEAVAALGVPSLDGQNLFTGLNEFSQSPTFLSGRITLGTNANALDGSAAFGPYGWTLPSATGTLALTGAVIKVPYVAKTGTASILANQCVINCNGTFTVTLPTAVGVSGQMYFIKNSGVGVVTVACTGGQTIDGLATQAVAAGACMQTCSDGANWIIL